MAQSRTPAEVRLSLNSLRKGFGCDGKGPHTGDDGVHGRGAIFAGGHGGSRRFILLSEGEHLLANGLGEVFSSRLVGDGGDEGFDSGRRPESRF